MEPKQDEVQNSTTDAGKNIRISTQCKACEKYFTEATIFKHISHRQSCKTVYSTQEIHAFQNWSKKRTAEARNPTKHDAKRRRDKYLKEKEKNLRYFEYDLTTIFL